MLNDDVKAMLDGPQWTPLDSAPQDGTDIIVGDMRAIGLGRFNGIGWDVERIGGWTRPQEITHWLPVPEDEVQKWRRAQETLNGRAARHG